MPIDNTALINVVQQVAEDANVTATVTQSAKGALIAGACAFLGGIVAGPVGLGIGGIIGAVGAAANGSGKYKSITHIIMYEMTPTQRNLLATSMQRAVADIQVEDAAILLGMIMSSSSLKTLVIRELGKFLRNEMGMALSNSM